MSKYFTLRARLLFLNVNANEYQELSLNLLIDPLNQLIEEHPWLLGKVLIAISKTRPYLPGSNIITL